MRKRIFKWLRGLIIAFLVLVFGVFFAVRQSSVQTYLVNAITDRLSRDLGTVVRVQSVEIDLWARMVINGLYIEDLHRDTLLFAPSVRLRNYSFNRVTGDIAIKHAELQSPYFNLMRYEGEKNLNMAFLLDYLSGTSKDTTATSSEIRLTDLRIRNGRFNYINENREARGGLDWNHLYMDSIFLDVEHLTSKGDDINAYLNDLSFIEKSGFELKGFRAGLSVLPGEVKLTGASIATNHSAVRGDLSFQLESIDDLDDFERKVGMNHILRESVLELGDIGYFTSSLRGIQKSVVVSGKFKGKVSNLKGKDIYLKFDTNSWFRGGFHMDGLPEIDETFITCDVTELISNKAELERIPLPPFAEGKTLDVPENLSTLGSMRFTGNFTGFINDFVAFGNLNTDIGSIQSDIALKEDPKLGDYIYVGTFGADRFDLGKFVDDPILGELTTELKIDGSGLSLDRMDATLDGVINSITINDYTFVNIRADGTMRKRFFDGVCQIDDPHLIVDFIGQVNFQNEKPELKFTADIFHMDLKALGLLPDFPYSALSGTIVVNSIGFDPNDFVGNLSVTDLIYCSQTREYALNRLEIGAVQGNNPRITLDSDVATGYIEGQYNLKDLMPSFKKIAANVVPSYEPAIRVHSPQSFSLRLDVLDFSYFSDIFVPDLDIAPGTRISLLLDEPTSSLTASVVSDSISYQDLRFNGLVIDARRPDESVYVTLTADEFLAGKGMRFPEFALDAHTEVDSVYTDIVWGTAESKHQGDMKGKLTVRGSENFDILLGESSIRVNKDTWNIIPGSLVMMDSSRFEVPFFQVRNGLQQMDVHGIVSRNPTDEIFVDLFAFDLAVVNPFLGEDTQLGGTLTGSSSVSDVYESFISNNDLLLLGFQINDYNLGDVRVETTWDNALKRLQISGDIEKEKLNPLHFAGYYTPSDKVSPLDLVATVSDLDLSFIGAFLDKEILGIKGFATGTIAITGTLEAPQLEGVAMLRDAWVYVPYLNCSFRVLQKIGIYPDMFTFDYIGITDTEGSPGFLTGQLIHTNFDSWSYDLVLDVVKPFLTMNTTEEMNSLYYGKAYASGSVHIYGYDEHIEFDIKMRTERGTKVSMPMTSSEEQTFSSFIRFIDSEQEEVEQELDLSGISMTFELDITPDAEFQIIFDEAVGDVMKGRGSGHINMEITNLSTFNMYGTVELVSGDYLFTLKNLLNKEFTVKPGGTIAWYGDPFAGDLNLEAIYRVNASLYDLMPDATGQTGLRVPVDLVMNLTGRMLNPGISFDIRLPTVDDITRSRVESIINTEQERNRQAFSLLVLRRFVTPPNITSDRGTSGNALAENSSELLSSQISNWLSQISDDFNLGFNYRAGDDISNEEIALALSTQLFNERLAISGNFGVSRGNEANQNPTNYIGDIRIEYKITTEGKLRLVVYNESNDFRTITTQQSPYTQGVGILYQEEFDTWDQFVCGFTQIFVPASKRRECI